MCATFTPSQNQPWVQARLGVSLPSQTHPSQTYPGYEAPLVVKSRQNGRVACGLARFGLIPSWAKDDKIGRRTYNARAETVASKPSYREAWKQSRFGIVPVDAFFEPAYVGGKPQRWRISLANQEPLGIACIWENWLNPLTGQRVTSFSLLTVNADAHPVMRQFHAPDDEKRTPVILHPDQFNAWLDAEPPQAAAMMHWQLMPSLVAHPPNEPPPLQSTQP